MLPYILEIKSSIENGDISGLVLVYLLLLVAIPITWTKLFHTNLLHRKYLWKYLLLSVLFLIYLILYVMGILSFGIGMVLLLLFVALFLVFIFSSKGKILWPCSSICSAVESELMANKPDMAEILLEKNKVLFLDSSEKLRYYFLAAAIAKGKLDIRRSYELLLNVDTTALNYYEKTDLALQKAGYAVQLGDYNKADLIIRDVELNKNLSEENLIDLYVNKALLAQFKGDLKKCSDLLLNAISVGSDHPESKAYQLALNNLGQIRRIELNFTDALIYYKKALSCAKKNGDKRCLHIRYQNVIFTHFFLNQSHGAEQVKKEYYSAIDKENIHDLMEFYNFLVEYYRQNNDKEKLYETFEEARERLYGVIPREQQLFYDNSQLRMRWHANLLKLGFLSQIDNYSGNLNSKLFSLNRMKILWALSELGEDGATARQIKNGLNIGNDGSTYSNLNALVEMGYLRMEKVSFETKDNLELYVITPAGLEEWDKIKTWLDMLVCEDH